MARKLLIDAAHPEETRLAVLNGSEIDHFEVESNRGAQTRGNIYLAQITRVEASLQAAFVEYGGERQGFLSFPEIHPDYYQIPVADKQSLLAQMHPSGANEEDPGLAFAEANANAVGEEQPPFASLEMQEEVLAPGESGEPAGYKIQEVIKNRQVILVQVVKEPRGNKGAALTTFISLPGRYCILMPNAAHAGGVSRKISDGRERNRLRGILAGLTVPDGMGLIIRTAGMKHRAEEIKQDCNYLLKLWETIRNQTLSSVAPALVYEEGNLVRRALRDIYNGRDEIVIEGGAAIEDARKVMDSMLPDAQTNLVSHEISQEKGPIFAEYGIEQTLEKMFSPIVQLKSGGYLVINQTEALVAIDINSGRSTGARHIQATALATNLEAADEIARQLHLRDLAGLIVIDFIDMATPQHNREVERRLRNALYGGQAHVRIGRISSFGLLELSRQRLRPALWEQRTQSCPQCHGQGRVASPAVVALGALRAAEAHFRSGKKRGRVRLRLGQEAALYLMEKKRGRIEALCGGDSSMLDIQADDTVATSGKGFILEGAGRGGDNRGFRELAEEADRRAEKRTTGRREEGGRQGRSRRRGGRGRYGNKGRRRGDERTQGKERKQTWWQRIFSRG